MPDKFTFGSAGLIHELEMGMARAGDWDPTLVKLLTSGDHLVHVREYLRGRAQFVPIQTEEVQPVVKKKPLPFQKNQNGHYIITLTGVSRLGTEEVSHLEARGFIPSVYAKQVLESTGTDSYDAKHRLAEGQVYQVALVPGRDYKAFGKLRTTKNLQAYGQSFGYGKALAGMIPRVRETVSDEQMEEMGFWYLAGLHDPIEADGNPRVLNSRRSGSGRYLATDWGGPDDEWDDDGAFVFPVSP